MMSSIHPREFFDIYVATSLEHYMQNRLVKHLAVNALSQMDNLAEIVAMHQLPPGRTELKRGEASQYREQLRSIYPVLGVVTDAHDCHKHNKLTRKSANDPIGMKEGRPEQVTDEGFFLDETELGGDLTPYDTLAVTLNDGTQWELVELLCEAIRAWKSEFQALGI